MASASAQTGLGKKSKTTPCTDSGPTGSLGANPFLLALSLYLDIFNLFLSVLRFMSVLSGERR